MVVVDETLLHTVDVTAGLLKREPSSSTAAGSRQSCARCWAATAEKVCTVDAEKISVATLGKNFP